MLVAQLCFFKQLKEALFWLFSNKINKYFSKFQSLEITLVNPGDPRVDGIIYNVKERKFKTIVQ